MGKLKEFLIEEQMRMTGDWREQNHYEYLAWRVSLKEQKHYEQKERVRSLSYEQKGEKKDRQIIGEERKECS